MRDTGSMRSAVALAGLVLLNRCAVMAARDLPVSDMPGRMAMGMGLPGAGATPGA